MRLYTFDEVDSGLKLVPMAARRVLDAAGLKLSLKAWHSLDLVTRQQLTDLGSRPSPDPAPVKDWLRGAVPAPTEITPPPEPAASAVPDVVTQALGASRPLPDAAWSALSPLDRYALFKVASKGRAARIHGAYAEIVGASAQVTHLGPGGEARMVHIGEKGATRRSASAESFVQLSDAAFARLRAGDAPKGDVLGTARLAGIMAAKKAGDLIPLCHPLSLTKVDVEITPQPRTEARGAEVRIEARVEAVDRTGVEMEALTAASIAALTIYDMLKAFDRTMSIGPLRLLEKTGGRSGDFKAAP